MKGWDFLALFEPILNDILTGAGFTPAAILREWKDRGWIDLGDSRLAYKQQHRMTGKSRPYLVTLKYQAFKDIFQKSEDKVKTK